MGRQRNNPQMKGKEEASERMINEIEATQLSDTEFKAMVIRKLTELRENYQKLQRLQYTHCKLYRHEKKKKRKLSTRAKRK